MARPPRIEYAGALYHVTSCGNAQENIYQDDTDSRQFYSVLAEVCDRFNWIIHAYCLMDNHYHLLFVDDMQRKISPETTLSEIPAIQKRRRPKHLGFYKKISIEPAVAVYFFPAFSFLVSPLEGTALLVVTLGKNIVKTDPSSFTLVTQI